MSLGRYQMKSQFFAISNDHKDLTIEETKTKDMYEKVAYKNT